MMIRTIAIYLIALGIIFAMAHYAYADNPHHEEHDTYDTYNTYNEYVTTEQVTDIVNTTNIENYSPDQCAGVAIAQAGANNQMYFGTKKPQMSFGVGECNGEFASSLMFGMRINNNLLLNGSWGADNDVNAFGMGATWVFK